MSFVFGGSRSSQSSKSSGSYNKSFSGTSKPIVEDWIKEPYQQITADVGALDSMDPTKLVPGSNPLIDQAAGEASRLTGSPWNFNQAADVTRGVMTANAPRTEAVKATALIDDFMNPYLKEVVDATAADFDVDAARTRAQQDLDLNRAGAFGGSGVALTKSATEGELSRARASTLGGLRHGGFRDAVAAAMGEATRRQGANDLNAHLYAGQLDRALGGASQLAGLSTAMDANTRANLGAQVDLGQIVRGIQQQQNFAPLDFLAARTDLLGALGLDRFFGQEESGTESGTESSKTKGKGSTLGFSVSGGGR